MYREGLITHACMLGSLAFVARIPLRKVLLRTGGGCLALYRAHRTGSAGGGCLSLWREPRTGQLSIGPAEPTLLAPRLNNYESVTCFAGQIKGEVAAAITAHTAESRYTAR